MAFQWVVFPLYRSEENSAQSTTQRNVEKQKFHKKIEELISFMNSTIRQFVSVWQTLA